MVDEVLDDIQEGGEGEEVDSDDANGDDDREGSEEDSAGPDAE